MFWRSYLRLTGRLSVPWKQKEAWPTGYLCTNRGVSTTPVPGCRYILITETVICVELHKLWDLQKYLCICSCLGKVTVCLQSTCANFHWHFVTDPKWDHLSAFLHDHSYLVTSGTLFNVFLIYISWYIHIDILDKLDKLKLHWLHGAHLSILTQTHGTQFFDYYCMWDSLEFTDSLFSQ